MEVQHTLAKPVSLSGRGLFGGQRVTATFDPAPANHGIVFSRCDLGDQHVPARIEHVITQARRTTLRSGEAIIETCEHCLSALAALNIDNVLIRLDGPELPDRDGSARPFYDVLSQVGVAEEGDALRHRLKVIEPVVVRNGDATLAAVPCDEQTMHVIYELDYGPDAPVGPQLQSFNCANGDYAHQLAPARTFAFEQEAAAMQSAGFGTHLTEKDMLVIGPNGPIGNEYRFQDELVRHKIVDLIGDLYLVGAPIQGRIIAHRSGHALNHALVRKLIAQQRSRDRHRMAQCETAIDIRRLMRILPHSYPMLLVDRVTHIEGDKRITGIKNVTINEPFFQGHYPTTPVMPGVLMIEAIAQLAAVLVGQKLENTGKLGFLMSMDRVKIRRPVTPGDQLILEAETLRMRSRIAHVRGVAYVGDDVAAEVEVKFMLVDDDQE